MIVNVERTCQKDVEVQRLHVCHDIIYLEILMATTDKYHVGTGDIA